MIAVAHADPADAELVGLFHGDLRRPQHGQVPQPAIAVDDCRRAIVADDTDLRLRIGAAVAQPAHVLRQAERAVGVEAGQVGLHHQPGHGAGVAVGDTEREEGVLQELRERIRRAEPRVVCHGITSILPNPGSRADPSDPCSGIIFDILVQPTDRR